MTEAFLDQNNRQQQEGLMLQQTFAPTCKKLWRKKRHIASHQKNKKKQKNTKKRKDKVLNRENGLIQVKNTKSGITALADRTFIIKFG